jgi:hypothetical protein
MHEQGGSPDEDLSGPDDEMVFSTRTAPAQLPVAMPRLILTSNATESLNLPSRLLRPATMS